MNQLVLEWVEAGQINTLTITDQQPTKQPGATRIGRDPARCDVIISNPTVSGLHVEITFDPQRQGFYLRNLRDSNPPVIGGRKLTEGDVGLQRGMRIYLGQVELKVVTIALNTVPKTVIVPPQSPSAEAEAVTPTAPIPDSPSQPPLYGLMCPKCRQVSPYERLRLGCPWCGTSLAAAASILMMPEEK